MLVLQAQLRQLDKAWPRLQSPMFALQGLQDELVNPATVDYLEGVVDKSLLSVTRFEDQGHFVLWESPELITRAIKNMNEQYCRAI